jgi:hypothetical protein
VYAGHVGVALAQRRAAGAPPLWMLVLAAQGPDWGDAVVQLVRLPAVDPGWSPHGLVPVAAGTLGAAALAARLAPASARTRPALLVAGAYASHWVCDTVTAYKPTWPHGPMVGLYLYGRPAIDFAVETVVIVAGWALWRSTLPSRAAGGYAGGDGSIDGGPARAVSALLLVALVALQAVANAMLARGGVP